MNYLDDLAIKIERTVDPELVPVEGARSLFRLYALLALVKGTAVDREDVHDAWVAWMSEREPDHRSIKPFSELDPGTQAADAPFVEAVKIASKGMERQGPAQV